MASAGVVKKWFVNRGFGFITPSAQPGDDIFVHFSALNKNRKMLNIGENVTYDVEIDERSGKYRASNVTGDGTGTPAQAEEPRQPRRAFNQGFNGNMSHLQFGAGFPQQSFD